MGRMLPNYFLCKKQTQYKKRGMTLSNVSKPLVESYGTKQSRKSSYTIPKGPPKKEVVNKPKQK
jgi:hypothetical protein